MVLSSVWARVWLVFVWYLLVNNERCNAKCICTEDASSSLVVYQETVVGHTRTIQTNGIDRRDFRIGHNQVNPRHSVCLQPAQVVIPVKPTLTGNFTTFPMGVIGILKTGGYIYNPGPNKDGVNNVANHLGNQHNGLDEELHGLDICPGKADALCTNHNYSEYEVAHHEKCAHIYEQWDACELIGWIFDGFPLYSHCFYPDKYRDLQSCYSSTRDTDQENGDNDSSDYSYIWDGDCDLDEANGFEFTGKGILDSEGNEITGYAYMVSKGFPHVMSVYAGSTWHRLQDLDVVLTHATSVSRRSSVPTLTPSQIPSLLPTFDDSTYSLRPSYLSTQLTNLPTPQQKPLFLKTTTLVDLTSMPTSQPIKQLTIRPSVVDNDPPTVFVSDQVPIPFFNKQAAKAPIHQPSLQQISPSRAPQTSQPARSTPQKTEKKKDPKIPKLPTTKNSAPVIAPTPQRISLEPSIAPSAPPVGRVQGALASAGSIAAMLLTCGMGN